MLAGTFIGWLDLDKHTCTHSATPIDDNLIKIPLLVLMKAQLCLSGPHEHHYTALLTP